MDTNKKYIYSTENESNDPASQLHDLQQILLPFSSQLVSFWWCLWIMTFITVIAKLMTSVYKQKKRPSSETN